MWVSIRWTLALYGSRDTPSRSRCSSPNSRTKEKEARSWLTGSSGSGNSVRNSEMDIKRNGSQPSGKGPDEYFTGRVRIDPLFQAPDPARVLGASVTFEPGARTAWHTHPLGQTLIVTAGAGRAQS